jgi:hypothetical protein
MPIAETMGPLRPKRRNSMLTPHPEPLLAGERKWAAHLAPPGAVTTRCASYRGFTPVTLRILAALVISARTIFCAANGTAHRASKVCPVLVMFFMFTFAPWK